MAQLGEAAAAEVPAPQLVQAGDPCAANRPAKQAPQAPGDAAAAKVPAKQKAQEVARANTGAVVLPTTACGNCPAAQAAQIPPASAG